MLRDLSVVNESVFAPDNGSAALVGTGKGVRYSNITHARAMMKVRHSQVRACGHASGMLPLNKMTRLEGSCGMLSVLWPTRYQFHTWFGEFCHFCWHHESGPHAVGAPAEIGSLTFTSKQITEAVCCGKHAEGDFQRQDGGRGSHADGEVSVSAEKTTALPSVNPAYHVLQVEGNLYFPPSTLKKEYFEPSNTTTVCGWKGTAKYYNVNVDGQVSEGGMSCSLCLAFLILSE